MPEEFQYDVFLSHSAKDKAVVRDVAERLRKDGVKVWFDEWELKPGDSIESPQSKTAKIEEGLERSRVLVLCMSANAFGSDWAQLESGTFQMQGHHALRDPLNKERRFLLLRLDAATMKGSLRNFFPTTANVEIYNSKRCAMSKNPNTNEESDPTSILCPHCNEKLYPDMEVLNYWGHKGMGFDFSRMPCPKCGRRFIVDTRTHETFPEP